MRESVNLGYACVCHDVFRSKVVGLVLEVHFKVFSYCLLCEKLL